MNNNERMGTHWVGCGDSDDPRHVGCPKTNQKQARRIENSEMPREEFPDEFANAYCNGVSDDN